MFIIVISGLPGSGKSHLAEYIAEKLKLPMICKDSIKEVLIFLQYILLNEIFPNQADLISQ